GAGGVGVVAALIAARVRLRAWHAPGHERLQLPNRAPVHRAGDGVAVDGAHDRLAEANVGKLGAAEVEAVEDLDEIGTEAAAAVLLGRLVDAVGGHRAPVEVATTEGGIRRADITLEHEV